MPNAMIKAYAKQCGKSVDEVEQIWNKIKAEADSKFDDKSGPYWAYINASTRKILRLKEHTTFKNFINQEIDNV